MQYDMQKLGRMTLDQLKEIAQGFQIKIPRNVTERELIYEILDAQAVQYGAAFQAREEAREEKKRGKRQRIQNAPQKVNTANLKGNRVLATVGSKEETMEQIKEEQAKQPQPKPVVSAVPTISLENLDKKAPTGDTATAEPAPEKAPAISTESTPNAEPSATTNEEGKTDEVKKKKRGRPKKAKSSETAKDKEEGKSGETVKSGETAQSGEAMKDGEEVKNGEAVNPHTPSKQAETQASKQESIKAGI